MNSEKEKRRSRASRYIHGWWRLITDYDFEQIIKWRAKQGTVPRRFYVQTRRMGKKLRLCSVTFRVSWSQLAIRRVLAIRKPKKRGRGIISCMQIISHGYHRLKDYGCEGEINKVLGSSLWNLAKRHKTTNYDSLEDLVGSVSVLIFVGHVIAAWQFWSVYIHRLLQP